MTNQPDPQLDITVAAVFRQRYIVRVAFFFLWDTKHEATAWLCKVANVDQGLA